MSDEPEQMPPNPVSLGEALNEYVRSLKAEQRRAHEPFVRRYVEHIGDQVTTDFLTGSRVESYAESQIRVSDPQAPERVAALKAWFQFLRKKNYTSQNFGVNIRIRRSGGRGPSASSSHTRLEEAPIEMTADGIEALRRELEEIDSHRPELVRAISVAREDKDFRENAPLEAAREALAFHEQRRKQIEATLKRAVVVDRLNAEGDRSTVGSTVTVTRLDNGKSATYKLVGAREANAAEAKISVESPVGKELLGRRPGDSVSVVVPSGEIQFRVDSVKHA